MDSRPVGLSGWQWIRLLALGASLGAGWWLLDVYRESSGARTTLGLALARALRGVIGTGLGALIGGRLTGRRGPAYHSGGMYLGSLFGVVASQLASPSGLVADLISAGLAGVVAGIGGAFVSQTVFPADGTKRHP